MPLYEFKCRDCDHQWDERVQYRAPLPDCPECGSGEVKKVYHATALIFKGSGWHVNDYASGKAAANGTNGTESNGDGHENGGSSNGKSSSDSSTESKPTTTSSAKDD